MADNSTSDSSDKLSLEAREAIRSYVIKLVGIPAGVLTLLSGIGGYFIHGLAYEAGADDALKPAIAELEQSAVKIGDAQSQAQQAEGQATKSAADTKAAADRTEAVEATVNATVKQTSDASSDAINVANHAKAVSAQAEEISSRAQATMDKALASFKIGSEDFWRNFENTPAFQKLVENVVESKKLQNVATSLVIPAFNNVNGEFQALRSDLRSWPPGAKILTGGWYGGECPPGSYVSGVTFLSEGGLAHGALYGGQVICRALNVGP